MVTIGNPAVGCGVSTTVSVTRLAVVARSVVIGATNGSVAAKVAEGMMTRAGMVGGGNGLTAEAGSRKIKKKMPANNRMPTIKRKDRKFQKKPKRESCFSSRSMYSSGSTTGITTSQLPDSDTYGTNTLITALSFCFTSQSSSALCCKNWRVSDVKACCASLSITWII